MDKMVYSFNEGSKEMSSLLGNKGANLAEMIRIGLPVPFGFTITTEVCRKYYDEGKEAASEIEEAVFDKLADLEKVAGKKFGDPSDPLLLSVRSGAQDIMPGIMPTILDLGLNDETVLGLARTYGNEKLAYDCYRRFIRTYSMAVLGIPGKVFAAALDQILQIRGTVYVSDLDSEGMKAVVLAYKKIVREETGDEFPQNTEEQLLTSIKGIFDSWYNDRAVVYRRMNNIVDMGTAVSIQRMVYGNLGDDSGTGAVFTRSPITGEDQVFGEFLVNAQGEDLVSGIRTPDKISKMKEIFPDLYDEFIKMVDLLEKHYTDMQDIEFTVEKGKLYIMQTKKAKRTAVSAVKVAVDMGKEGMIDRETAILRLDPIQLEQLFDKSFKADDLEYEVPVAHGLASSPGAASGAIMFSSMDAQKAVSKGEKVILVRAESSPEDFSGMVCSEGVLTSKGGMTSHAAVVARGMGKCCISAANIKVDELGKTMKTGGETFYEGDKISLDGTTGRVYKGLLDIEQPRLSGNIETIMGWADKVRDIKIRANADNPGDAKTALDLGAEGIGLCRTERMFLNEDRLRMIAGIMLTENRSERKDILSQLMHSQKDDFAEIYRTVREKPVTIRLLDPPFHEIFPHSDEEIRKIAKRLELPFEMAKQKIDSLHEFNPMLGKRGVRIAIEYPEIASMQAEAIAEAAIQVSTELDIEIVPEIMIPFVGMSTELRTVRETVDTAFACVFERTGKELEYKVGTIIEVPRAAFAADRIAKDADFFVFGANDLTQLTLGISRDDMSDVIKSYRAKSIIDYDPFKTIDTVGVGGLIRMAVDRGREAKNNIGTGLCGEQAGDPKTIRFCTELGLDYISCSPYLVPVAKLAAGQASVKLRNESEE